ncbi:hypothetical protein ES703_113362 [subsurface metagenome]
MFVLGAGYAALGHGYVAQADVERPAALSPMANQALAGVVGKEQLDDGAAHLVHGIGVGFNHHALGDGGGAGGGKAAQLLDFDNAKAAAAVGFKVGVGAKGGNVDVRRLGGFEHGHPRLGLNLLAVDS